MTLCFAVGAYCMTAFTVIIFLIVVAIRKSIYKAAEVYKQAAIALQSMPSVCVQHSICFFVLCHRYMFCNRRVAVLHWLPGHILFFVQCS